MNSNIARPLAITALALTGSMSLAGCGGSSSHTAAPSSASTTVSNSTASSASNSTTVTSKPASKTTATTPAHVTKTVTQQAPAPAVANSGGGTECMWQGHVLVLTNVSCEFGQNMAQASSEGNYSAYSPVTHRYYTFTCQSNPQDGYNGCGGGDIANGGKVEWNG